MDVYFSEGEGEGRRGMLLEIFTNVQRCLSSLVSRVQIGACLGQQFQDFGFVAESSVMNGSIAVLVLKSEVKRDNEADRCSPRSLDSRRARRVDE